MNKREAIYQVITEAQEKHFNHVNWNCATFVGACIKAYSDIDLISMLRKKDYVMGNWHNGFIIAYRAFLELAKGKGLFTKVDSPRTGDLVFIRTPQNRIAFAIWYDGFAFTLSFNKGTYAQRDFINVWRLK